MVSIECLTLQWYATLWDHVKLAIAEGEDEQALRLAVKKGHLDIMKYLVGIGANIRAKPHEALMIAAREGIRK